MANQFPQFYIVMVVIKEYIAWLGTFDQVGVGGGGGYGIIYGRGSIRGSQGLGLCHESG